MIALLGALREEVSDIRKRMNLVETLVEPTFCVYRGEFRGQDVLLTQTGMGRQRAEEATRGILECYDVTALVSFGFAGALAPHLKVGDVVVCSTQHCSTGSSQKATRPKSYQAADSLLRLAEAALEESALRHCTGSGVTVPQVVCSPQERQELSTAYGAQIVDMESYWVARIAADCRIPFVAVRAVSDTERDTLPPLDGTMMPLDGEWQWGKAITHFLRHPQHLAALHGLARNARAARGSLTVFADCLVSKL
jgi:5'-methylthioadenosine/S-adenosylhomocysteine nucleosidase